MPSSLSNKITLVKRAFIFEGHCRLTPVFFFGNNGTAVSKELMEPRDESVLWRLKALLHGFFCFVFSSFSFGISLKREKEKKHKANLMEEP
jgi:hypothetical protein